MDESTQTRVKMPLNIAKKLKKSQKITKKIWEASFLDPKTKNRHVSLVARETIPQEIKL